MFATADRDLGLVPGRDAARIAREAARELGQPVHVRDPVTDRRLRTLGTALALKSQG
jgi:hypothetical protein